MKQKRFDKMPIPPKPTIRTDYVAERIAKRIVEEVNLDEFYWTNNELPDRVWDVQQEIMREGKPATVFVRLEKRQPLLTCGGRRVTHPYGWEGMDDHCRCCAPDIAREELQSAIDDWRERYGK